MKRDQEAAPEPSHSVNATILHLRWGRVLLLVLPLTVLNAAWIANAELRTGITEVTTATLFMGVVLALFVLTLLNLMVRRVMPRAAFCQAEMMAVYALLSLATTVAGVGHLGFLLTFLGNPFRYGSEGNSWSGFYQYLPQTIAPRDPAVLKGFYEGHSDFFQPQILRAWAFPLAAWGIFFLILIWTTLCFAAILSRRWADDEHLPFPIVALPLEMTRDRAPLYRSRLFWFGFALPTLLHTVNALATFEPTIPSWRINTLVNFGDILRPPLSGMDNIYGAIHPAGLGFGYLIGLDVSFSLWFFYVLKKLLGVAGVAAGWRTGGHGIFGDNTAEFPFTAYQGWGAWLALGLATVWTGRAYFRDFFHRATANKANRKSKQSQPDSTAEAMSPRLALYGFAGGFLALCGFVWISGGSPILPVLFLAVYLLLMVGLSRIRAETAVLATELVWINPQSIITGVLGTTVSSGWGHSDLVQMATLGWFNMDYRAAPMPHQLEGIVGMKQSGGKNRISPLIPALILVAAVAIVASLVFNLQMYYINGAATAKTDGWRISKGSESWRDLAKWLSMPKPPNGVAIAGMVFGFGFTFLLSVLRARFIGFPLNPAAYVLNMSFANDFFWFDMLLAWLCKLFILRYGGLRLFQRARPLFLGLILGDFVIAPLWSTVGAFYGLPIPCGF